MPSIVPMQISLNQGSARRRPPSMAIAHSRHAGINTFAELTSISANANLLVNNSEPRRIIERSLRFEFTLTFHLREVQIV